MDNYVYQVGGKNYINLTNRCNNACDFCIRQNKVGIPGFSLWLEKEPEAGEVIAQLDAAGRGDVVFCGYGEPTLRLDVLKEVAAYVKSYGGKVRVNTNGLSDLINGRKTASEFDGLVDIISISLNASTPEKYQELCHSQFGLDALPAILSFTRQVSVYVPQVVLSVVDKDMSQKEIAECERLARQTGALFRIRAYIED